MQREPNEREKEWTKREDEYERKSERNRLASGIARDKMKKNGRWVGMKKHKNCDVEVKFVLRR